eukprot:TRINITY_DN6661_c0_g1_i2.p1 TRINITY_DN6661_c0_g1~~TRINITY_DN6661_c0_g1_i2.p1  ORF type:complete len:545 (+),score=160.93 TRINITY_DN6661_c0_g1_i2:45-1679(+)
MDNVASVFQSQLDTSTEKYAANMESMTGLIKDLNGALSKHLSEGSEKSIARHKKRGQLTFRERLDLILDEDSPFLELMPLAGYGQKDCDATNIVGIGLINGVEVMVTGSVPTVKGGTMNAASVIKGLRAQQIAAENGLMTVQLVQSGGADLRQQEKVFHEGGKSFYNMAKASNALNTLITVVFGSSTAGGAYQPGMSDYTVMVKGKSAIFLGGPPLVKMATGEIATTEELGGAIMHNVKSGVSDYLAEDERHGIRIARELVAMQHRQKMTAYPEHHLRPIAPPIYDEDEILGLYGGDIKTAVDVAELVGRIVDGSRVTWFKPEYGKTTVCAFAEIHGFPVGIIGNNGVLMPDSTSKATQFIQRCNMEGKPIVFLQNITGFMVGSQSEQDGLIKHGSLLINAVSNSIVPLITIMVGASYGAGNYAMCGRAYNPRFLFSWPNSKCGVMGPEQLSGVLDIVARGGLEARKKTMTEKQIQKAEKALDMQKAAYHKQVEQTISVYYTSSRCLDDGIIDPRDTRNVLGFSLSVIYNQKMEKGGIFGISRM